MSGACTRLSWLSSSSYSKSEIARSPRTIDLGPVVPREVDCQDAEGLDLDVAQVRGRVLDEGDALIGCEQRPVLAHRQVDDGDDHGVEHRRRARDHVEVAIGDRVVGTGTDCDAVIGRHGL